MSDEGAPAEIVDRPSNSSIDAVEAPKSWTDRASPFWIWALRACAAVTIVPLWRVKHLPITDLPQHVAVISTLRHWFDPAFKAQEYFTIAFGKTQYLLYYVVGTLLAFPLGPETANRVLLSLIAIAFPFSLRALLRALRMDERLALFACTMFWNPSLMTGLFNYLAAIPLLFWGFAAAIEQGERPTRRRAIFLAVVSVSIFYLHISAFIYFVIGLPICMLLLPMPTGGLRLGALLTRLKAMPRALLFLAPVGLGFVHWAANSAVAQPQTVGWKTPRTLYFPPIADSLRQLPEAVLDIWRSGGDEGYTMALVVAAILLAWPQSRANEPAGATWRRGVAALLVASAATLYFAMPAQIGFAYHLNDRYAIVAALLLPLLFRPAPGIRGAAPLLLVAIVAFWSAAIASRQFLRFESDVGQFDALLTRARPGARLVGLGFETESITNKGVPTYVHFGAYYRVRYGGVASFAFAELPQSPLRYRKETGPPEKPMLWEWDPCSFDNVVEGAYYDYILVRARINPLPLAHMKGPQWREIGHEKMWTLYEKIEGSWSDEGTIGMCGK